jgi:hypothetical protein
MKICVVTPSNSAGGRALVAALVASGAEAVSSETSLPDAFNVGWGKPGSHLNRSIPPNKLWEMEKCKSAGVSVVQFSRNPNDIPGPVFSRLLSHTKGRDIIRVENGVWTALHRRASRLRRGRGLPYQGDFYTGVIPKAKEYRVHVFDGKAVRSGTKMKQTGETSDEQPIWNLDHGFQIRYEHPAPDGAKKEAKAAVEACGLDFAAVDVLESAVDGRFYVLELNCRPGLHGNTITKYVTKIMEKAASAV